MSDQILFKGTTIFDSATTGIGYEFTPASLVQDAVEVPAPLGLGHWIKEGNKAPVQHTLEVAWLTSTPSTIKSTIEGVATATTGDLVVPVWGTFSRCRLSSVGTWRIRRSEGSSYIVETTLTWSQYP